jgi:hypothetical protein
VGLNTFYKASPTYPARIYANDYNNDGGYDAITSLYLPDVKNKLQEFPAFGRDDMIKQMIAFKARFTNYDKYARALLSDVLTKEEIEKSLRLDAKNLASCYLKNDGNGHFIVQQLPVESQFSSIFGMIAEDVDGDSNLDIIINGNDYSTEISTGRYDAFSGLILKGDGKGNFQVMQPGQSGYYVPGDGKSLVQIKTGADKIMIVASENQGPLRFFESTIPVKVIDLKPGENSVTCFFKNGSQCKKEIYYGSSFYSQTGRYITAGTGVRSITIHSSSGGKREINF